MYTMTHQFTLGEADIEFTVTVAYAIEPGDSSVGLRDSVRMDGVVLDDLHTAEGLRIEISSSWVDWAEGLAAERMENADDWQEKAMDWAIDQKVEAGDYDLDYEVDW